MFLKNGDELLPNYTVSHFNIPNAKST